MRASETSESPPRGTPYPSMISFKNHGGQGGSRTAEDDEPERHRQAALDRRIRTIARGVVSHGPQIIQRRTIWLGHLAPHGERLTAGRSNRAFRPALIQVIAKNVHLSRTMVMRV